jgi:hypothetical protein
VAVRTSPGGGVVLAYFFDNTWERPPPLSEIQGFRPEDALRVLRVGDLGLLEGSWPVLGRDPNWRRDEWKVPRFLRQSPLSRRAWCVRYSDDDPNLVDSESPTSFDANLERDALFGTGAAEIELTEILD